MLWYIFGLKLSFCLVQLSKLPCNYSYSWMVIHCKKLIQPRLKSCSLASNPSILHIRKYDSTSHWNPPIIKSSNGWGLDRKLFVIIWGKLRWNINIPPSQALSTVHYHLKDCPRTGLSIKQASYVSLVYYYIIIILFLLHVITNYCIWSLSAGWS